MATDALLRPDGPWLHPLVAAVSDAYDLLLSLPKASKTGVAGRLVRGKKMRTTPAFYDEFAAALQFPYYFGENSAAFDDCVTDLEWLPADAYTILVSDSVHMLEGETPEQLALWYHALERAGQYWAKPVEGEFARGSRAFHVLLQCSPAEERLLHDKLKAAKVAFGAIK